MFGSRGNMLRAAQTQPWRVGVVMEEEREGVLLSHTSTDIAESVLWMVAGRSFLSG